MIHRSTWLHLRIPFSIFLLPVYLFALSVSKEVNLLPAVFVFIILHFFLYPASNGFNSYFDKDEESIGGLKHPPKVTQELYYVSHLFDLVAVISGLFIGLEFALLLVIYGLVSKAYSHPAVRLKKYAFTGWFVAGVFQGFFTFLMVLVGIQGISLVKIIQQNEVLIGGILATMLLWGSYPMTQVYQHKEDGKRGDQTISLKLGILGTFHFTALIFFVADVLFLVFYSNYYSRTHAFLFQLFVLPMLAYFVVWYVKVRSDKGEANFRNTMRLNMVSSICLTLFFIVVCYIEA